MTTNEETRDTALEMGRQQGEASSGETPEEATPETAVPETPETAETTEARSAPEARTAGDARQVGQVRTVERTTPAQPRDEDDGHRLSDDVARGFRSRWQEIQADFVDDPRGAVDRAESLVAEVMRRQALASGQSTEELRVSLQRYRSFVNDLLRL